MLLTQKSAFAEFFNSIGTRQTLAVLPHCWDERTFAPTTATTQFDPNRPLPIRVGMSQSLRPSLSLGHMTPGHNITNIDGMIADKPAC